MKANPYLPCSTPAALLPTSAGSNAVALMEKTLILSLDFTVEIALPDYLKRTEYI